MYTINLQNYRLIKHHRRGGQGNIFLGYQVSHGTEKKLRDVVVKIIRKQDSVESQLASLETHSNVITIFDSGTINVNDFGDEQRRLLCKPSEGVFEEHEVKNCSEEGEHEPEPLTWISMEYSTQGSLDEHASRRFDEGYTYSEDEVVQILQDILKGLDHAHHAGIMHGDIKPGNILYFDQSGIWKISDFGIARRFSSDTDHTVVLPAAYGQGHPGTNLWMAPEQRAGQDINPATDMYAVGLIGYYLMVGENYYGDMSRLDSVAIGDVIQNCLSPNPDDRYQRAQEILIELNSLAAPPIANSPETGSVDGLNNEYLEVIDTLSDPLDKIQETIRFLDDCVEILDDGCDPEDFYNLFFHYAVTSGPWERGAERVRNTIIEYSDAENIEPSDLSDYLEKMRMYECAREATHFLSHCSVEGLPFDEEEVYQLRLYYVHRFVTVNFSSQETESGVLAELLVITASAIDTAESPDREERWDRVKDIVLGKVTEELELGTTEPAVGTSITLPSLATPKFAIDMNRTEAGPVDLSSDIDDMIKKWQQRLSKRNSDIESIGDAVDWVRWPDTDGDGWAFIGEESDHSRWGYDFDCHYLGDTFKVTVPTQILRSVVNNPGARDESGDLTFVLIMLEVPDDCVTPICDSQILLSDTDSYWEYDYITNMENEDKWAGGELARYRRGLQGDYKYLWVPASVFDEFEGPPSRLRLTVEAVPELHLAELEGL